MRIVIEDENKKNIFTKIFKHLTQFTEIINVRCTEDKFYVQGMDSAHVSLFELVLMKDWFDVFDVNNNCILGVNIKLLSTILMMRNKEHQIVLDISEGGDELYIGLETDKEGHISKTFKVPIMDIHEDLLEIPDTEFPADFVIESKKIHELVDEMSVFGETLDLECTEEKINISSSGSNGKMDVEISFDDVDEYAIEEDKELNLKYGIKYVLWMLECSDIVEKVHIHVSDRVPMQIYYSLDNNNFVRFYLAPKIPDY